MSTVNLESNFESTWHGIKELNPSSRKHLLSRLTEEVCPECGAMAYVKDAHERVCKQCGLVQNHNGDLTPTYDQGVNTSPISHLSYGKSLGDTLNGKAIYQVLSKITPSTDKPLPKHLSSELKEYLRANIGLRARLMRIYNSSCDPAPIQRALSHGQKLCEEFGMTGEHAIEFRDFYGRLLRKVCTFAMLMKKNGDTFEAKRLAVTTFVFVWQLLEMQYRMRTKLHYQQTFPNKENRYRRGLQAVPMNKYKIRLNDWQFVEFVHSQSDPSYVVKKSNNGDL